MTFITGPVPPYSNPPIEPQYYQPSRFVISAITLGQTTTVTTTTDLNYVVGQTVRLLIPEKYGCQQLSGVQGLVVSIPASDQCVIEIDSSAASSFISSPYTATITNITRANPCVITANNSFSPGQFILIEDVGGMTQINDKEYVITSCNSTSITLNLNSSTFSAYTSGGIASLPGGVVSVPQIIAIGDNNSGIISSTGPIMSSTNIPGAFINISPL